MKDTQNTLKKITETNKNSRHECVSELTHERICNHHLLRFIDEDNISNKVLLDATCERALRRNYNEAVNTRTFQYSYEQYMDIHIWQQAVRIIKGSCQFRHSPIFDNNERLAEILADLDSMMKEKSHSYLMDFKSTIQANNFLQAQGCSVERKENAEGVDEIIIEFPQEREFTLPQEMRAINIIAKDRDAQEIINFSKREVVINKGGELT